MKKNVPILFLLLSSVLFFNVVKANEEVWLLVDTEKLQLDVKQGEKTLSVIKNIAIGRNGAGFKQRRGDDITPLGSFKIGWINRKSSFYRFYGFNYPSTVIAHKALLDGLLDEKSHAAIINAHRRNKTPPQNTSIGGQIGIHGLGNADKFIHSMMNWTHGCIALTNEQIDQLSPWLKKGTRVKVK